MILTVNTKPYGTVQVDERQKINFKAGLFGFEGLREYVLLDGETQPWYWLQSTENVNAAFVLIDPFLFRPDYEMDINDDELNEIGVKNPEDALYFTIVTIPQDGSPMTANLRGPVIINREKRLGKQVILSDQRWNTKHDIQKELAVSNPKKAPC
ncbi:MAG: flagellar assembly protein FliW [Spirochaetaceae bacterium]|nr:flagellar assembly protein FliW [Spirochaetaceae bacterium]GMO22731.1 MAG: flagellar assembly protein FliW [Termitinemataceae bacterium]